MDKKEKITVKNIYKNETDLKHTYTQKWVELINKKEKKKYNSNFD